MGLDARLIPFRLDMAEVGGTLTVDGADVTGKVGALSVQMQAGRPPQLTLYGVAEGAIAADGVVVVKNDLDAREAIIAFLDAVDPEELDRVATAEARAYEGSQMSAVLAVLRRWAGGQ